MKFVYFGFSLLCLAAVYLYYVPPESVETDKCENVFVSGVAADYYDQLGMLFPDNPKDRRAFHEAFVANLRKDPSHSTQAFMGANLNKAYQEFLSRYIPPYRSGNFTDYLKTSLSKLRANPSFDGLKHNSPYDDSLKEGNLPFLQFRLPIGTAVIRMAMPVMDERFTTPKIHPEFLAFIRGQKKHLYVNLMKRHGLEGPLSKAIESLDKSEPALAVVTLDKNSPFYWQEGDFPNFASDFKNLFLKHMQEGRDFYWSSQVEIDLKGLLEKVHFASFQKKSILTQKERQDFIELVYLEILDNLTLSFRPESMNITCKQAMDRAPSLAVLWQWKHNLVSKEEAAALLFAPPLLVHNRPTHRSRLDRFISALEFFYPNNPITN